MENFFVDLSHLDLLCVSGEDSGKFLQGQLTCDVTQATASQSIPGAICNNKGRVLANFRLLLHQGNYYLEMNQGLLAVSKSNLDKFIVFYKAETADAGEQFTRLGLVGHQAAELLNTLFTQVPQKAGELKQSADHILFIPGNGLCALPRYELWLPKGQNESILEKISRQLEKAPGTLWEIQNIHDGLYNVTPEVSGEFTPQLLNYDIDGHVNFKKGCYTGQEIVARMHYRGKPKKRLFRFMAEAGSMTSLAPGEKIIDTLSGQSIGEVMQAVFTDKSLEGLALLDTGKSGKEQVYRLEKADLAIQIHIPGD